MASIQIIFTTKKGDYIEVDENILRLLFDCSIVNRSKVYHDALENKRISFSKLKELSRTAEIPYTLFFANELKVNREVKLYQNIVLKGRQKGQLAINSRGDVNIWDIGLIVKDLVRKQEFLKKNSGYEPNDVADVLKRSKKTVKEQADLLKELLGYDLEKTKSLDKSGTLDYLIALLEAKNVFVSQYTAGYAAQYVRNEVKFSGVCIKDKCYPYIFLMNREDDPISEPPGRKILTLVLLIVCLSKSIFKPVALSEASKNLTTNLSFLVAEEFLMPESEVCRYTYDSREELEAVARLLSVTPSALVMRLYRLEIFDHETRDTYLFDYKKGYTDRKQKSTGGGVVLAPEKGIPRYNGNMYTKQIIRLYKEGHISEVEAKSMLSYKKGENISFERISV